VPSASGFRGSDCGLLTPGSRPCDSLLLDLSSICLHSMSQARFGVRQPAAAGRTPKRLVGLDQPTVYLTHTVPRLLQTLCQGFRTHDQTPAASQVFDLFGMTGPVR
jgi:hypothetical protein